mmetsp:Transcript_112969/g.358860  ORF Transcript_112969/g.358860 Transcript_112969/m.358860 type:complete len:396 (+) Transcript_112969:2911-4098(+)
MVQQRRVVALLVPKEDGLSEACGHGADQCRESVLVRAEPTHGIVEGPRPQVDLGLQQRLHRGLPVVREDPAILLGRLFHDGFLQVIGKELLVLAEHGLADVVVRHGEHLDEAALLLEAVVAALGHVAEDLGVVKHLLGEAAVVGPRSEGTKGDVAGVRGVAHAHHLVQLLGGDVALQLREHILHLSAADAVVAVEVEGLELHLPRQLRGGGVEHRPLEHGHRLLLAAAPALSRQGAILFVADIVRQPTHEVDRVTMLKPCRAALLKNLEDRCRVPTVAASEWTAVGLGLKVQACLDAAHLDLVAINERAVAIGPLDREVEGRSRRMFRDMHACTIGGDDAAAVGQAQVHLVGIRQLLGHRRGVEADEGQEQRLGLRRRAAAATPGPRRRVLGSAG